MEIIRMPVGIYAANCYIIYSKENKEAIVIDPGGDGDEIINQIDKLELSVKYIILTHAHADHIAAIKDIRDYTGAELAVHREDKELLEDGGKNLSSLMAMGTVETTADLLLNDRDKINFGNLTADIIHTPGHTPGGISIKIDDSIFTGDTLFAGSIGRTDFPGSSYQAIMDSIKNQIMIYQDDTKIYPGHGPSTSIDVERKTNPFIIE